jgi:hypothetical protein
MGRMLTMCKRCIKNGRLRLGTGFVSSAETIFEVGKA